MWDNKYDPPESIFDGLEPATCAIFIIALFAIIPFTPLSPFAGREPSALDDRVGLSGRAAETRVIDRSNVAGRVRQVETHIDFVPVAR